VYQKAPIQPDFYVSRDATAFGVTVKLRSAEMRSRKVIPEADNSEYLAFRFPEQSSLPLVSGLRRALHECALRPIACCTIARICELIDSLTCGTVPRITPVRPLATLAADSLYYIAAQTQPSSGYSDVRHHQENYKFVFGILDL
jgi:hypothetical protein